MIAAMKRANFKALCVCSFVCFLLLRGAFFASAAEPGLESALTPAGESGSSPENSDFGKATIRAGGYLQLLYRFEQVENGTRQAYSGDEAVQTANGFTITRARVGITAESGKIGGRVLIRLEGGALGLLEAYGYYRAVGEALEIYAGQMKIPSTYEVAVSDEALDFVTRSRFSMETPNWSLSRSTSEISPFRGVQTYFRDLGAAVKGAVAGFEYFLFVGNGLGANYSIGKSEPAGILHTNSFGAFFYGARGSCDAVKALRLENFPLRYFILGGYINRNIHQNVLYQDDRSVFDFDRFSWAVDLQSMVLNRVRVAALYGSGKVDDDLYNTGEVEYRYRGGEFRVLFTVIPDTLEAGVRYESYTEHESTIGDEETMNQVTLGVTYTLKPHLRFQLNYLHRWLVSGLNRDTADDLVVGSAQLMF
jgi:hypothetical protein